MVNIEQIQMGLNKYIEEEIAKKATGFNKFAVYFALPSINKKIPQLITNFKDNEMAKDFFDENGNINLDEIYNNAKIAISKSGQFSLYGIIFNETDVDKLYNYIKNTII